MDFAQTVYEFKQHYQKMIYGVLTYILLGKVSTLETSYDSFTGLGLPGSPPGMSPDRVDGALNAGKSKPGQGGQGKIKPGQGYEAGDGLQDKGKPSPNKKGSSNGPLEKDALNDNYDPEYEKAVAVGLGPGNGHGGSNTGHNGDNGGAGGSGSYENSESSGSSGKNGAYSEGGSGNKRIHNGPNGPKNAHNDQGAGNNSRSSGSSGSNGAYSEGGYGNKEAHNGPNGPNDVHNDQGSGAGKSEDYLDLPPGTQPDAFPHLPKIEPGSNPYKQPDEDEDGNDYLEENTKPETGSTQGPYPDGKGGPHEIHPGGYTEHPDGTDGHGSPEHPDGYSKPDKKIGEFFPEDGDGHGAENGGHYGEKPKETHGGDRYDKYGEGDKDKYSETSSSKSSKPKSCCGCCKDDVKIPFRPKQPTGGRGGSKYGHEEVGEVLVPGVPGVQGGYAQPGAPGFQGYIPALTPSLQPCCQPAPFPCCPTIPNCCLPALPTIPCCPRAPPPPCCPALPTLCCQPVLQCCPPPPPAQVCCSAPAIPVCYRACPACPCRRRVSLVKRLKRQSGAAGGCSACSTGGQPALGAYQHAVPPTSCRQCSGRKKRQAQNSFLSAITGNTHNLLSGLHSGGGQSSCGTCQGARKRIKRFGCVPCLGRKKREAEEDPEEVHKRAKRLGCLPCLARAKKSIPGQGGCHSCSNLGHLLSRFKRTISCTICHTAQVRAKRQVEIDEYNSASITGGIRRYPANCQQCAAVRPLQSPPFQPPPMPQFRQKRDDRYAHRNDGEAHASRDDIDDFHDLPSGFEKVKPKSKYKDDLSGESLATSAGSYDSIFECDHSCCDYSKCIKVKSRPLNLDFLM
ncbi:hypothetical protein L596_026380 [Steinernema carpocapsae]|uniref:Uncharacterized protein n=2 Tax=Steinernema carpocapsae TaxID=34508 RepID=A0A4U5M168_STECR|nr:hypothetical protein L596_026380 [Steinernema carpocapsae]